MTNDFSGADAGESGLRQAAGARLPNSRQQWRPADAAIMVWLVAVVTAALLVATLLNRGFQQMQLSTAERWHDRGLQALHAGDATAAVADFQTAILHNRDNSDYLLDLARALAAAGKESQARAYLLGLWQDQPGSGELNLQLARIAARQHNVPEAQQFFHGAIFGVWQSDPIANRIAARRELINFLLAERKESQALSELVALSATVQQDAPLETEVGELFLRDGQPNLALKSFQEALDHAPRNATAAAAAGKTAFDLGQFTLARNFLERAVRLNPADYASASLLRSASTIEAVTPFDSGLRYSDLQKHVLHDFHIVGARLRSCAQAKDLDLSAGQSQLAADAQHWSVLRRKMTPAGLRADPDLMETTANLELDIEQQTSIVCGEPSGEDLALLTIARKRAAK
jgi:tetratricopeptide (TPR) repeat protein